MNCSEINLFFYSPKITFGIDFSIQEKQDVFIYIRGGSIQPHGMFQQATRCRNIDKLYYYGEVIEQHIHFHNLDEVKRDVKLGASMTEELINGCTYINEVDEIVFIENMFFNLFCYNEYVYDIYKTNKVKHFELLLEENGFKLSVVGDRNVKINKTEKKEMKSIIYDIKAELFDEYINDSDRNQEKYAQLVENMNYLGILGMNNDLLLTYKDIIIDKYKIEEHDNIIRLHKSDDFINGKLRQSQCLNFNERTMVSIFNKIKLIRDIEEKYNIGFLNVTNGRTDNIEMDGNTYKLIRTVFRTSKKAPTNFKALMKLYAGMIRHVSGNDLIVSKKLKTKTQRDDNVYFLNQVVRDMHLELNSYKNMSMNDFINDELVAQFIKVCDNSNVYLGDESDEDDDIDRSPRGENHKF